jgi:phytol kinase
MSAFIPYFYFFSRSIVLTSLLIITILYIISEILRSKQIRIPFISNITELASRTKDEGKIVFGPITLSLGIFLALIFFDYRTAIISIFALAFGDGVASLFGKIIGGTKIPFTFGKTISGSFGCFIVLIIVFISCGLNLFQAVIIALIASITEAFPTGDLDNLLIPLLTGIFTQYLII